MYIYPNIDDQPKGYPLKKDFSVNNNDRDKGFGVYTRKSFKRGSFVARFMGEILTEITQHSLQVSKGKHIYDPHFAGMLLHSCDPNIVLDMNDFTVWAIKDIEPGEPLTMDYASTEDYLFRQFRCLCEADNCRQWITGRRESVSHEGEQLLKQLEARTGISVLKAG